MRALIWPIGPRPSTTTRAAVGDVGVLDGLPRGGQHVGQEEEPVVGRPVGHLDRAVLRLRHPQVLGLAAGHLAVELGVAEQRGARAVLAHLGGLALRLQARASHIKQWPQEMLNGITTRSPDARSVTVGADLLDDAHRLVAEDVARVDERAEHLVEVQVGAADRRSR